jgi:hypothetical protein
MSVHKVKINGVIYGNVGSITPEIQTEYYHNVTALDGTKYQQVRYKKTNYKVQFFNVLDGVYVALRKYINRNKGKAILCGFPNDSDGFVEKEYYMTIQSEINKGYLNNEYFKNGLTVYFEAVNAD